MFFLSSTSSAHGITCPNSDDSSQNAHTKLLNPKAPPFYPRSTPMELNQLAKPFVPSFYNSVNYNVTIVESLPTLSHTSLNPLALPFISHSDDEIDGETGNMNCELHLMNMTPILDSISTPDLSLLDEDFSADFTCASSCESVTLNDTVTVVTCEEPGTLNPCAECFVSLDLLASRIGSLRNSHNENAPSRPANHDVEAQTAVLPQSPSTDNLIAENDDPKAVLQELKTKNRERPVIAHLNINFLDPKFEQLMDMVKDNVDILLVSETKLDDSHPEGRFFIEGYKEPI